LTWIWRRTKWSQNYPENVRIFWKFSELTDTGATGAPREATAEKGRRIMSALEGILLGFIRDMDRHDWKYGKALT
jgi:Uncharacterized protein, putative amidase